MKKVSGKQVLSMLVVIGGLILGGMTLGGCGETTYDEISYFDPNWTPEGNIYARMVVSHYKNEWQGLFFGGQKTIKTGEDTYFATMDTNGTHQSILPYSYYPYFSPKGTYVCYVDNTSTFHIVRRSDNTQVYSFQPTTETIAEFDWGPEEDKLVFATSISANGPSIYLIDIDGNNLNKISEGMSPTWSPNNTTIVFNRIFRIDGIPMGDGLCYFLLTNEVIAKIPSLVAYEASAPDFTSDEQTVLFADWEKEKIDAINIITGTKTNIVNEQLFSPKWHVANGIVYGKDIDSGIWISNANGTSLKQLK